MNSIEKAELYFILPVNKILGLNETGLKKDQFLEKLIEVQEDEFNKDFCDSISRKIFFKGEISYQEHTLPLIIYISNYLEYESSLIYLKVSINNSIKLNDFANLINGKNVLHNTHINNKILFDYLKINLKGFGELDDIFLFLQIAKTNPEFPNTYNEGMKFIEEHKQNIHQLLLRSDTYHDHLRIYNHQSNFDNIANFYGTIDLCSPITLIQFYQYPINSIGKKYDEYDVNHRACWWLVITDIIFIQKSVLTNILNKLSQVEMTKKMKNVKATTQLGKVLRNMKDFWYFEDLIHEISKAVIFRVKKKVGVESMLDSVLKRAEYLENMVLREINEEQNEHNYYLSIIVTVIAMIQVIPLIHKMLDNIDFQSISFFGSQFGIFFHVYATFVISFILPLMIWRKLNKRKFSSAILTIKKSKTNN